MLPPPKNTREKRLDSLVSASTSSRRSTLSAAADLPQNDPSNEDPQQNYLTRHSPPVQPNERQPSNVGLPSFSQVKLPVQSLQTGLTTLKLLKNVHSEPSPPRTPNRSNGSTDSSPIGRSTQWEEVAWGGDSKRRRLDSTDGQYRPSYPTESIEYEPRRPSALDPAVSASYGSNHPRPSLPFGPQIVPMGTHARHQSSPIPQGHPQYQNHGAPAHHSVSGPSGYAAHASQYDRRSSYYPEPHPAAHSHAYERTQSHTPYYGPPPTYMTHGGYNPHAPPQAYSNFTFQSALGVDQNSFNRKRRGNLPKEATALLKKWFADHRDSPYPTEDEKLDLCQRCGLTLNQVRQNHSIIIRVSARVMLSARLSLALHPRRTPP
jgi:hypothetical protein